ncbi:MAG: radical SAM protein, partial [Pseudomonadota bacterium]
NWVDSDDLFRAENKNLFDQFDREYYESVCEEWISDILDKNPTYFGVSLLSSRSHRSTEYLLSRLKQRAPHIKTILGGPYALYLLRGQFSLNRYVDYLFAGDAENSVKNFAEKNRGYPGINSLAKPLGDLDEIPLPSYDKDTFSLFDELNSNKMVYVTGSRGCVRNCSFCCVRNQWPKFQFRSAESIVKEIERNVVVHGRRLVRFTDSLVNGSPSLYRKMCLALSELLEKNSMSHEFRWRGQFICRPKKLMPEKDFEMTKRSNGEMLFIGIESGSEDVRKHMGKHITNEDIRYTFEQLHRYEVGAGLLLLVGYPTETEKDFQETIDLIKYFLDKGYFDTQSNGHRTIVSVSTGPTMQIIKGTPVFKQIDQLGINYNNEYDWVYKNNNFATRKDRYERLTQFLIDNNIEGGGGNKRRGKVIAAQSSNVASKIIGPPQA